MKHIFIGFKLIGATRLLALTVGCANAQHTENLLSAAGFRTIIANAPQWNSNNGVRLPRMAELFQGIVPMASPIIYQVRRT